VATKKKKSPAGDFITSPVSLPAINFNVSITPQITADDSMPHIDNKYVWFVYDIRINGSQPCMSNRKPISVNGEVSIEELKAFVQSGIDYVSQYIEQVTLDTIDNLIQESRIACWSEEDIKEKLAGVMQFVLDRNGYVFKAPENKSYLHWMLGDIANGICHRVQGERSYAPVKNEKIKIPPLNPSQLRNLDHSFEWDYERIKKARKLPDGKRGEVLGNQPDPYILNVLEERYPEKHPKYPNHKYEPKQIAYVYAAREAGARNITMKQWKTIERQLNALRKRSDKDVILYGEDTMQADKTKLTLSGKKRTK
jgi:hypothetical protein